MRRPNILLLFTDMQRADTIGALGNPIIRTPGMDRLVREGTAFTRCFSPSPVCVPARYSLHYGRWPHRTNCFSNNEGGNVVIDDTSYVARLGRAGYRTHGIGKTHFAPRDDELHGYHSRETQTDGGMLTTGYDPDDYVRHLRAAGYGHVIDHHGRFADWYYLPQVAGMPAELHPTQWVGDRSIAFIEQAQGGQPWYLTASFIHPHPPYALPVPWYRLYDGPDMPDPVVPHDRDAHLTWVNRQQNRHAYRDQGVDRHLLRQIKAAYYGCISFVDYQIGRILAALERSGQLDDTLIVFSSDHGDLLGDYHSFGKCSMHDASARVSLLARLPGRFAAGAVCETPTSLIDIASTFCSLGGADGEGLDGLQLHEVAAGRQQREAIFSQHGRGAGGQYLVTTRDWSLFWSAADQREYVYHRATDPQQQRLVPEAWHPREIGRLRRMLHEFLFASGQHDAVERNGDRFSWRLHERPRDDLWVPSAGQHIQPQPWQLPQLVIPGYTRPEILAERVRTKDEPAFVRRLPDTARAIGLPETRAG